MNMSGTLSIPRKYQRQLFQQVQEAFWLPYLSIFRKQLLSSQLGSGFQVHSKLPSAEPENREPPRRNRIRYSQRKHTSPNFCEEHEDQGIENKFELGVFQEGGMLFRRNWDEKISRRINEISCRKLVS